MILCGPFVDSKQSLIDQCETDGLSYEEIFNKLIKTLEELLQDLPMTQVILQPSTRDVHHKFIFPTPEFKIEVSPRIVCVPDPAMVSIFSCQITLYCTNFLSFNNFFFDDIDQHWWSHIRCYIHRHTFSFGQRGNLLPSKVCTVDHLFSLDKQRNVIFWGNRTKYHIAAETVQRKKEFNEEIAVCWFYWGTLS